MPRQLALPFPHAPHFRAEEFLAAASNADALAWLRDAASWPLGRLALWGPEGCGKTHLLHLWAERHGADCWPARGWRRGCPRDRWRWTMPTRRRSGRCCTC